MRQQSADAGGSEAEESEVAEHEPTHDSAL